MKRLLLSILIVAALSCVALAQIVATPQLGISRRDDILQKSIANMAYHSIQLGTVTAVRAIDGSPLPILLVKGFDNQFDCLLSNAIVEHWKVALFPELGDLKSKTQGVRGSNNKTRQVYELGFTELDILKLGNGQAMFTGDLPLDSARLGPNTLFSRAETKHASQTSALIFSNTTWMRNYLNDGIAVVVLPRPATNEEKGRLLLQLKQAGYYFSDPAIDAKLTALANGQLPPVTVETQGKTEEVTDQKEDFDTSKLDAPALQITVDGKSVVGDAVCNFRQTTITIDAGGPFRLCVYRVDRNGKEELIKDKSYPGPPLKLTFQGSSGCEYRFEVHARGQLLGLLSLKEAK